MQLVALWCAVKELLTHSLKVICNSGRKPVKFDYKKEFTRILQHFAVYRLYSLRSF